MWGSSVVSSDVIAGTFPLFMGQRDLAARDQPANPLPMLRQLLALALLASVRASRRALKLGTGRPARWSTSHDQNFARGLCQVSAFTAQGPLPLRSARAVSPVCQFGTGNGGGNGYDEKGNPNFFLSPIAGGSKVGSVFFSTTSHLFSADTRPLLARQDYPYGKYELDLSGELPAKLLAFIAAVGLPIAACVGIWTADV